MADNFFKPLEGLSLEKRDPAGVSNPETGDATRNLQGEFILYRGGVWEVIRGMPGQNKGDLIIFDGTKHEVLAVGDNGKILVADDNEPLGVKWIDIPDVPSIKIKGYSNSTAYESANGPPSGGESFYNTTDGKLYTYNGVKLDWVEVGSGAGGSGGGVGGSEWEANLIPSPSLEYWNGLEAFAFDYAEVGSQKVVKSLIVPDEYDGQNLVIKIASIAPSGVYEYSLKCELYREDAGLVDDVTITDTGTGYNKLSYTEFSPIVNGKVDTSSVLPSDVIIMTLSRAAGPSGASTDDLKLIKNLTAISFKDP